MANGLTAKQKAFVREYASNGYNGTKAAIAAGYSEKTAEVKACQLLAIPEVQQAIAEEKARLRADAVADREERQRTLTEIMRDKSEYTSNRLKAMDMLCRMNGDYLERHEIVGPEPLTVEVAVVYPAIEGAVIECG